MKDYIIKRALTMADYILENKTTVRETSGVFDISKSTVHKDVTERLKQIDYRKYAEVKKVLDYNLSIRHIRGGNSTKQKYQKNKNK